MTKLHGCHNRQPMVDTQRVQVGWSPSGHRLTTLVPFVNSRDCRHDKKDTDPGCAGCRWQIGASLGAAPSA